MSTLNLVKIPVLDPAKLKYDDFNLDAARTMIADTIQRAKEVVSVITQSDLDNASQIIVDARKILTTLELHRKQMKQPALDYGKEVDNLFKILGNDLGIENSRLGDGVNRYNNRQKGILQAKADAERDAMQAQLDKEKRVAEETGAPFPDTIVPEVVVKHEKLSQQNSAGLATRRQKKWRVVDIAKVPIQYLEVNEVLLNEKRKETSFEGESPIPGIEYSWEERV